MSSQPNYVTIRANNQRPTMHSENTIILGGENNCIQNANLTQNFFYYFHSLPITLTSKFLNQINIKLKNFIWKGKKPKVAFTILTSNSNKRGMGLPGIRCYYQAAILDQMKYWFSTTTDKLWSNIEKKVTNGNDMYALSTEYILLPKFIMPQFITIRATLIVWKHFI